MEVELLTTIVTWSYKAIATKLMFLVKTTDRAGIYMTILTNIEVQGLEFFISNEERHQALWRL